MSKSVQVLISMNYEVSNGGIARVARLMAEALPFDYVLSFHGNSKERNVSYFNKNRLAFTAALIKRIIQKKPKLLVFDHAGPASLLALVPAFLLKGAKVVVFLHDEEAWGKVSNRHSLGLQKATHLLCNSDYTYQKFILANPSFISKTQVCLLAGVPDSFLTRKIDPRPSPFQAWFDDTTPYCLFVSRLWKSHRYKGHFELLEAFSQHHLRHPGASLRLAIVGNGDDVENLKNEIAREGLQGTVTVFTGVQDQDLALFYKNCAAFVFPSTREGFGFVFLEAMFFSKACIGISGQPAEEIISPDKSGILLPDNKPETIAAILNIIELQPEKYAAFGEEGKRIFNEKFMNIHFKERFLKCIDFFEDQKMWSFVATRPGD